MGGVKALQTVEEAAKEANPELQDTAIHVLGQWLTTDAAPVLLNLAKTAPQAKNRIRAMHGYIRIAREFDMPDRQRAAMCRAALRTAKRDAEKKQVLEVIKRHPSIDMLRVAVEAAKIPSLKNDAAGISLTMAQKIGGASTDVRKLLVQVGHDPVKVEIIKAEYGAGTKFKDVTKALRRRVRDFPLIVLPSSSYNVSFGGDPVPGVVKQLRIQYRIDGKEGQVSLQENAPIMLPTPK
jgi:hypothetical protein